MQKYMQAFVGNNILTTELKANLCSVAPAPSVGATEEKGLDICCYESQSKESVVYGNEQPKAGGEAEVTRKLSLIFRNFNAPFVTENEVKLYHFSG